MDQAASGLMAGLDDCAAGLLTPAAPSTKFASPDSPRPLRIALLGYRSNPFSGGQGIFIAGLAKALTGLGHQVDVISGPPYPELDAGIRLVRLPSLDLFAAPNHVTALRPAHCRSLTNLYEYSSMLTGGFPEPYTFGRRLIKWMRRHGADYDLIHDNQSLCHGLLALQRWGLPVVATIHHPVHRDRDIALSHARNSKQRLLIRRWYAFISMQEYVVRRLANLVTISQAARTDIAAAFDIAISRISVIYNGIDTNTFRPIPLIPREHNLLMAVASADQPMKGLGYLLEALARLRVTHPSLRLLVVGPLRKESGTRERLRALGLSNAVTFRSGLTHEEIVTCYARATLAVVPSLYEGFGLPAGEALACGLPLVSTHGGALPEVIGEAGVMVPPGDVTALTQAIRELLDDPARRANLAAHGRRRIMEQFNWSLTASRMTAYYETVLAAQGKANLQRQL